MDVSNTKQEANLKTRLYRHLSNRGLDTSKENKSPELKLYLSNSSNLFEIKQRQPVCRSSNPVLQMFLEASIGSTDTFRQIVFNKQAIRTRTKNHKFSQYYIPKFNKDSRCTSADTTKKQRSLTNSITQQVTKKFQSEFQDFTQIPRPRIYTREKNKGWQTPSKAIGVIAPKPILISDMRLRQKRKTREVPNNKKYEALKELNSKIGQMWKHWGSKMQRNNRKPRNSMM